jgi:hypothetical protein
MLPSPYCRPVAAFAESKEQASMNCPLRVASVLSLLFSASVALAAPPLPALSAASSDLTVSGISSGGYMAVQFQVAYSALVRGAGVLAGGPYYCAEGKVGRALNNCMAPTKTDGPPPVAETLKRIEQLAEAKQIDPVKNLNDDRVWLLSGGQDKTAAPAVMDSLAEFIAACCRPMPCVTSRWPTPVTPCSRSPTQGECLRHQQPALHQSLSGYRRPRPVAEPPARPAQGPGRNAGR